MAPQGTDVVLDERERARAAALRRSGDREVYLAAHVGTRLLLGAYLGLEPRDVPLVRLPCPTCGAPHGRPAVEGDVLPFSLSHTGGVALLAFAGTPVGADVEQVPELTVVEEIAPQLHPREAAELAGYGPRDRPWAFARTWARKEAYLKGLGTGLGRDLSADHVGAGARPDSGLPGWRVQDVHLDVDASGDRACAAAVAVRQTP